MGFRAVEVSIRFEERALRKSEQIHLANFQSANILTSCPRQSRKGFFQNFLFGTAGPEHSSLPIRFRKGYITKYRAAHPFGSVNKLNGIAAQRGEKTMVIKPSSLNNLTGAGSCVQTTRRRALVTVLIFFPVCFLLTACGSLLQTFRSSDCDIIQKADGGSPAVVSGRVGRGEPTKGTGWFLREQGGPGTYFIQFDPPFSAAPRCCVESQQSSFSKLSVGVVPGAGGLHLEATDGSQRCLRMEKRVAYGYVVEERCAEWQTVQEPWKGRLKFTCVSQ